MERPILVCGAGTLGGHLVENLARMGTGPLFILDRDLVEERNCANQPYSLFDVGQPKVKALSEFLFRAVGARVTGVNRELTPGNAERHIAGMRLVIDAFDNSISRRAVKEACERASVPCLHAGLSPEGYGEAIWNERYAVPPDGPGDPCERTGSRSLSLLVVVAATRAVRTYLDGGGSLSFTVTEKDLRIEIF